MKRGDISFAKNWLSNRLVLGTLFVCVIVSLPMLAAPQAGSDIPPDATPQIQQIAPNQASPGAHVTVVIQGSNFCTGAYASSISPAVHVDSYKRVSATQLEVQVSVSPSAPPSTVSLLVSNPASRAAEAAFTIVAGQATTTPATGISEPPKPAVPATPEVHVAPPVPPVPAAPAALPGPEVTTIDPPRVGVGADADLKVTGRNFAQGCKVSFANTGIRVTNVTSPSSTEFTVRIKVASDAAPGVASMFVINPDDHEVEVPFEVTGKGAANPVTPPSPATTTTPGSPDTRSYDAFHLGNPAEIIQVHGKVKGALVVSGGTIKYIEAGKTLVNISVGDIKEIKTSSVATATFHITLASGKTYHFAPGSLRPSDARSLVDSLRKALPLPN